MVLLILVDCLDQQFLKGGLDMDLWQIIKIILFYSSKIKCVLHLIHHKSLNVSLRVFIYNGLSIA